MSTIHPTWDHEPETHRDTSIERERRPSTPYPSRSRSRSPPGGPCQGELECEGRYDCACASRRNHGQYGYGDDDEDSLFDDDHEQRLILPPSTSCLESDTDTDSASVYSGTGDEEGYPSDVADVDGDESEEVVERDAEDEIERGRNADGVIGSEVIFKEVEGMDPRNHSEPGSVLPFPLAIELNPPSHPQMPTTPTTDARCRSHTHVHRINQQHPTKSQHRRSTGMAIALHAFSPPHALSNPNAIDDTKG
ncbi:hypothetical protein BD410DRAFT_902633 [Rickenella mellea]|uniref:Uncharacterized protein n=1 Tax=Rickenella mellea TaxID=50990 RepID=A0A4Y7PK50_9AGAM|nr:hypothetical protein BD410DRAFT_902633 [Rickenella mellea]